MIKQISKRELEPRVDVSLNNQEGFALSSVIALVDHSLCVIVRILPYAVARTDLEVVGLMVASKGNAALVKSLRRLWI